MLNNLWNDVTSRTDNENNGHSSKQKNGTIQYEY